MSRKRPSLYEDCKFCRWLEIGKEEEELFNLSAIFVLEKIKPRIAHVCVLSYGLDGKGHKTAKTVGQELFNSKTQKQGVHGSSIGPLSRWGIRILRNNMEKIKLTMDMLKRVEKKLDDSEVAKSN